MQAKEFDLIVIGSGVLGTFHAYHALNRGMKVALIEKDSKPISASVRNFGQIVPSGMNPKWQRYGRKSLKFYKKIQTEFDISIRQNGSIYLASNEEELNLIHELHHINQLNDYPSELLSQEQCISKYPSLQTTYVKGGLFFPEEVSVNPREMLCKIHQFLKFNGNFSFFPNTAIHEINTLSDQTEAVDTAGNSFLADKVIVCSGEEFSLLFPELFKKSDLEVVKLQMLRLKGNKSIKIPGNILTGLSIRRYESFQDCPSYSSLSDQYNHDYFARKWGVHILFKQETDGSIILGDSHEYADAPHKNALSFDNRSDINQYFIAEGKKIFELESWEIDTQWAGYYTQCKTKDILQKTIDKNIHIVTGIGGKGMTASAGFAYENIKKIFAI
ncbi:TIGR03364 family FAD-dependent oxidoreductase [Flexithrix dorotheae]|uniref:TIGR03364 family FAD-dependent oxidoreductase n=1 Tax=Flexithrix dorotheae TaxID=70993 RepID=UPI0003796648|nr:TIGR03364 family FAD-dependent oxidoreductase [Flexithrix dorotheae]